MSTADEVQNSTSRRVALFLVIVGALFAVDFHLKLSFVHKLWPLAITMLSIGLIGIFVKRNAKGGMYLSTGVYLLCFSGLALYCNFTASWHLMGKLWPLFITFLGIVFIPLFAYRKKYFYILFGLSAISLSAYFYLIFNIGGQYWWTIFIFIGLSMLLSGWIGGKENNSIY